MAAATDGLVCRMRTFGNGQTAVPAGNSLLLGVQTRAIMLYFTGTVG
jgi:hypothetical protein